ncbi:MAG: ribonuclease P protein component [Proteobacteria bacterium]|nr:ribonuclease P protein component [Pseudomonadota bacterium]
MENKKKTKDNRESLLSNRVYSKHFVAAYGFINKALGIFFGLSAKSACTVRRNKIKRIFRSLVKEKLANKDLSICLISKKGTKIDNDIAELREELEDLVEIITDKIR